MNSSERRHDVLVFGEAIVDFLPAHPGALRDVELFRKSIGGAPANLALTLARLGGSPKLLTRLGADEFGHFLLKSLRAQGVAVEALFTDEAQTGVTFISLSPQGERCFHTFRGRSADLTVEPSDFGSVPIEQPIVHFGSTQMTYLEGRRATLGMLRRAKEHGALTTMDANIRFHLWEDEDEIVPALYEALPMVDLLKVSQEEAEYLCAGGKTRDLYEKLREKSDLKWLVVTKGEGGARLVGPGVDLHATSFDVKMVDSTGAGDAFVAGLLFGILSFADREQAPESWLSSMSESSWNKVLRLANYTGASVCKALGATTMAPFRAAVPWKELGWEVAGDEVL